MGKNPDGKKVEDDDEIITEETLRRDKYDKTDVDASKEEDEDGDDDGSDDDGTDGDDGDDDGKTDDGPEDGDSDEDSEEDSDDDEPDTFIKEFDNIKGDTLPEYTRNLEKAYGLSFAEAKKREDRIRELEAKDTAIGDDGDDKTDVVGNKPAKITNPTEAYMKQKMDEEIVNSYVEFSKDYTQVDDPAEYSKFEKTVKSLSATIMNSEGRVASPRELYSKSAVILGWTPKDKKPTGKEKVGIAIKARAGVSNKGGTTPKKGRIQSKVSQAMIELNRKMYPGKTDAEIRDELEPHVQ